MTDGNEQVDARSAAPASATPPAPVQPPPLPLPRPPRTGDLTVGWRIVTAMVWISVAAAFAAVWNTSVQLGLATWWLGPRSSPQPIVVRLLPFAPPALMVLASINQIRRLPVLGLVAAGALAVLAIVDLGYVRGLAIVELAIAAAAALTSVASFTGTFRPGRPDATG